MSGLVRGMAHVWLMRVWVRVRVRRLVLMYKWDAGKALELIERERATDWTGNAFKFNISHAPKEFLFAY